MVTESQVLAALETVDDPELPLSIVDMGLVYDVRVQDAEEVDGARVEVEMTFTAMGCPAMGMLTGDVEEAVEALEGVAVVEVIHVWDPPWTTDRLSEEARDVLRVAGVTV